MRGSGGILYAKLTKESTNPINEGVSLVSLRSLNSSPATAKHFMRQAGSS